MIAMPGMMRGGGQFYCNRCFNWHTTTNTYFSDYDTQEGLSELYLNETRTQT